MSPWFSDLLARLAASPEWLVYVVLALAAALENLIPPIPADVTVLFGAFLAGRGVASAPLVFLCVWGANVAGALIVYGLGWKYGQRFFAGRWGRLLLRPGQLQSLRGFYERWGVGVVFVSRFVPMFRAVVPVFAGVARLGPLPTAVSIASASAIWYGTLVYLGAEAGARWSEIVALLASAGRWLWSLGALAALLVAWWWHRTR